MLHFLLISNVGSFVRLALLSKVWIAFQSRHVNYILDLQPCGIKVKTLQS